MKLCIIFVKKYHSIINCSRTNFVAIIFALLAVFMLFFCTTNFLSDDLILNCSRREEFIENVFLMQNFRLTVLTFRVTFMPLTFA